MINRRAWAEISREALKNNYREVKKVTNARIMPMVKSNAYGHGAVEASRIFLEEGAYMLGVACLAEAETLRAGGITAPILNVGYTPREEVEDAVEIGMTMGVSTFDEAENISHAAKRRNKMAEIHIKVDTGMTRLGFFAPDASSVSEAEKIFSLPNIRIGGIFTHMALADDKTEEPTKKQFALFTDFCDQLNKKGHTGFIRHALSSAAIFRFPEMHLDMVRPGICLYGNDPLTDNPAKPQLKEAMCIKATVARVQAVPAGTAVGYGATFRAEKPMRIATVLIGYGDGISRALSGKGSVIACGKRVPMLGRICMDQLMIDASDVNIEPGDVVTIRGTEGTTAVSTEEAATLLGTIPYELYCNIGERIPRIYV